MAPSYRIRFALPGPSADWGAVRAMHIASAQHEVLIPNNIGHDTVGNFDTCWCEAVNAFEAGELTHLVYLHADVHPIDDYWLDTMVEVAERRQVSLVSVPIAIKDGREVLSCGVSQDFDGTSWQGHLVRISTVGDMPLDFDARDLSAPGKALMHNTGCMLIDLRDPKWHTVDADGNMVICFNFPRRNRRQSDGRWGAEGNSEDFYFSRMAHQLGIRSAVTRRLRVLHAGRVLFPNWDRRREKEVAARDAELKAAEVAQEAVA